MTQWHPPAGVSGDSDLIKVSVGMLGPARYRCPARDALSARPRYRADTRVPRKPEVLKNFTNGPFMDVLDLVEHQGVAVDDALAQIGRNPVHDLVRQWTAHAVRGYLEVYSPEVVDGLTPMRGKWVYENVLAQPDRRGARQYRITVWGRCYRTPDGKLREVRLPANRLEGRARTDAEIAVAALVLASGGPDVPPQHVRLRQFGMLEGESVTLFDGSRQAALDLYDMSGRAALAQLVDAGEPAEYRPGAACVDCPFSAVCPELRRTPGLLGVRNRRRPRRSWSATSARNHAVCPARDYGRRQRLPVDQGVERGPAAERGRAVHRYLERQHDGATRPCETQVPEDWVPAGFGLTPEDRALGLVLLRNHAAVCPVHHTRTPDTLRVEPDLVYEDPDADTVVLARPDLLYHDGETWVWRELKTSASGRRGARPWLEQYPQLALATILAARSEFGLGIGRVELEILRPAGADLYTLDPKTPEVRLRAETVVRESFGRWQEDDRFLPAPGRHCSDCEVARWCSARDVTGGVE
ncbi:PD-(D/E)XK nuclease family protein [Amycolatopsis cihanbeyliensis]|uniref:PD-(D/E)XK nuclease superfamily protein n=1 Tax=Amycolatopsis cihanbeyliensis TaxID=1128664 RepID=A0A542CV02_AMYCI|nr:PD-(D/E)XK nuclease family protein [Amycolatopsis cihanbeyliensis]TQI94644.1 PD-(D/E)XK nuclease superfamily protein [Amycolatopsis cihanbeyliensis]